MSLTPVNINIRAVVKQSTEQTDKPVVTLDLVYWTGLLLLLAGFALGVALGSWLVHTYDAELRRACYWAWAELQHAYWAWASLHG